ncbi:helix-turn-helix transcriptional regulator [Corynebacterium gerontici]|uniref:Anaerobic benzoate catabolism transcriptional regulator n=1 Tax=Corynebacterium gerontici TaxID=2079234 RepID=A0A3G6J1Z9_9CORY|nr:helix-turn-helix transcriptional regulator [Corynebacterium gerontici]AZA11916.1 anaerobic benzoate catabolism transcriptional regulator [Corynebacterium gerontici]
MSATGNNVKASRRACGMSQQTLADAAGVSRQTVANIERGSYAPSVYLALRIARTLEMTVESLFPIDATEGDPQ